MFNIMKFKKCFVFHEQEKDAAIGQPVITYFVFQCQMSYLEAYFLFLFLGCSLYIHLQRAVMQKPPAYPANTSP